MALSAIAMTSCALVKIGADGISSFSDGTAEAEVASRLYEPIRDGILSSHPWSFATAQVQLARLEAEPVADFAYAYQLPTAFLRVLSAGCGSRGRGIIYRIAENRLHTNSPNVVLTYIFRPDERSFPAFFDNALVARLAAEFCLPLTESAARADYLYKIAQDEYRTAKLIDGQQKPAMAIEDFPLIEVRS